jgi:hypothetical protein
MAAGMEPYSREYTDIKWVARISHNLFGFVTYDPDIKTGQDLMGKKVGLHRVGEDPNFIGIALLKDAWGVWDEITPVYHGAQDHKDLMLTGIVDAALSGSVGSAPGGKWMTTANVPPLVAARECYWIPTTEEDLGKMDAANPWTTVWASIPKDAAGKDMPPEDIIIPGFSSGLACWDTADEEMVYELVKFLDENRDDWELRSRMPGGVEVMADFGPGITEDDVHPGALRYYKEKGISIGG